MIRRCQPLLGTFVEICLDGGSDGAMHKEAGKAFELISGIQHLMGFHTPDSDVSRLNRCAHIAPLSVHPWTWQVINTAVKLSAATEGAFDISIAQRLVKWGYLPNHPGKSAASSVGCWNDIEMLPDNQVKFHRPLQIDLGGIAKGFAVDKAVEMLAARGLEHATVNAGGDLRIHGSQNGQVEIRDPQKPQAKQHATTMLRAAVATSAAYFAKKWVGFSRVSPIVNPHDGKPLRSNSSVSVFAPTCMEADALTKAVLLAPQQIWSRILKERDSVALFLNTKGEQLLSPA